MNNKYFQTVIKDIETKLKDFIKSGKYKDMLLIFSNISNYSLNNQILIFSQNEDASLVYTYLGWKERGRKIKKNEKGIKIIKPIIGHKKENEDNTNVQNSCIGFQVGYVYDIQQTEGNDINCSKFNQEEVVKNKKEILNSLNKIANENGYEIKYTNKYKLGINCYGCCNYNKKEINILENMCDLQEISTTIHECAHMLAHSVSRMDFEGISIEEKRQIKEVEAESIACIVCSYLGLDTKDFNFAYICNWSDGEISKFKNNLEIISRYARIIINKIEEEKYAKLG